MILRLLVCAALLLGAASAAEAADLKPGETLRFEFPELPDTLASVASGKKQPAALTARLPENYTREGKFPLFIHLYGGEGGRGDSLETAARITGARDYILVSLPLFKRKFDPEELLGGLLVSMDDFAVISSNYRVMLQKLLDAVPNTTPEGSTLGGTSNGAHTTGVLLAGQDEFILEHFRAFYLLEGGVGPLLANVLQKRSLHHVRLLAVVGDKPLPSNPDQEAPFLRMARFIQDYLPKGLLNLTVVTMRGYGHEQPAEYLKVIGQWTRGEKQDEPPPKVSTEPRKAD